MITLLHGGEYAQMITILHRGEGSLGTTKSDYIICARPLIWWTRIMMMSTHHMMDSHHKSDTFWGKKCMMDRHHISQLISHQWHFPIKENCHHGYIKVVNCPTRLSSTEQKNKAWRCADIKQVLSRDLSELNFSYHQSDINQLYWYIKRYFWRMTEWFGFWMENERTSQM